jgi:hypothetical protein
VAKYDVGVNLLAMAVTVSANEAPISPIYRSCRAPEMGSVVGVEFDKKERNIKLFMNNGRQETYKVDGWLRASTPTPVASAPRPAYTAAAAASAPVPAPTAWVNPTFQILAARDLKLKEMTQATNGYLLYKQALEPRMNAFIQYCGDSAGWNKSCKDSGRALVIEGVLNTESFIAVCKDRIGFDQAGNFDPIPMSVTLQEKYEAVQQLGLLYNMLNKINQQS